MILNQVTLPAKDIKLSVDFYLRLGFTQIVDSPHYARFSSEGEHATFSLIQASEQASEHATIYFESDRLDAWVTELVAAGVRFEYLPRDESYLWREALLKDPSGNRIKLYWAGENRLNPPWRVDVSLG